MRLNSDGSLTFHDGSSGSEKFRVTNAGNVGIGTTGPGQKLDVSGSIKSLGRAIGGGATPGITMSYDTSNNIGLIETWTSKPMGFETAGVRRMTIDATNGNIGIGTTGPKLNNIFGLEK